MAVAIEETLEINIFSKNITGVSLIGTTYYRDLKSLLTVLKNYQFNTQWQSNANKQTESYMQLLIPTSQ